MIDDVLILSTGAAKSNKITNHNQPEKFQYTIYISDIEYLLHATMYDINIFYSTSYTHTNLKPSSNIPIANPCAQSNDFSGINQNEWFTTDFHLRLG